VVLIRFGPGRGSADPVRRLLGPLVRERGRHLPRAGPRRRLEDRGPGRQLVHLPGPVGAHELLPRPAGPRRGHVESDRLGECVLLMHLLAVYLRGLPILGPEQDRPGGLRREPGDFRIADALWSRGLLWLAFNDQCRTTFSWTACARLIELDTEANAVLQDFWVSSTLRDYFYPALALDGYGNLALIVGVSSSNDYPGLLVTGRLRDDPHGEFQPPVPVKAGSGAEESWCSSSNNRCRYGDYFGASSDPT